MGTQNYTPDPAQGAIIAARAGGLSYIIEPDDNEKVKASNIRLGQEQLADLMAFYAKGPANDIDFKITGNGTPPASGYTPTTNPIIIKGTGIQMFGASLAFNVGGTLDFTVPLSFDRPLNTIMESLAVAAYSTLAVTANNVGRQGLDSALNGVSVTSVSIAVDPTNDGLTPGTRVQVELTRKEWATGTETSIGSFIDTNPSESYHIVTLDLSGTPHTVDMDQYQYFVKVTGETGANANTVTWCGSRVTFDMSTYPFA